MQRVNEGDLASPYRLPEKKVTREDSKSDQVKGAKTIISYVSDYFGTDTFLRTRVAPLVYPRQISQYFIHFYYHPILSEQDIANMTGVKSHATVRNSREKIEFLKGVDYEVKDDVCNIKEYLDSVLDMTKTSQSLNFRKERQIAMMSRKLLNLTNGQFFDTMEVINEYINNYSRI